jgi:hypothetical protein
MSEAEARDLARRVAVGLAAATGLPLTADIGTIRLDLTATVGADCASLARQIVAATVRAIGNATKGGA